jgi:hypothetical protein
MGQGITLTGEVKVQVKVTFCPSALCQITSEMIEIPFGENRYAVSVGGWLGST